MTNPHGAGVHVCSLPHKDEANARLIAAAPDLLDACIATLSQLTEDRDEYRESDIEQLRAAIAKATQQP